MKLNKIEIGFITASILSLAMIFPQMLNYVEFYKAIEKCEIALHEVSLDLTNLNKGNVGLKMIFNFTNPTRFAGLAVTIMTCNIRYTIPEEERQFMIQGTTQKLTPPLEIIPFETTKAIINLTISYLNQQLGAQDLITNIKRYKQLDFTITGQCILKAYTYIFPITIGPFQYSVYLD